MINHPSSSHHDEKTSRERGVIMSVVQGGMSEPRAAEPAISDAPVDRPSDRYLNAFELLDSASKALEFLEERRDDLETTLRDVSQRAEAAVAASASRAADWQRFAADLKARNVELERQVEMLERRAEQAEIQHQAERERAETAERRTTEAQHLLRGLHGKVISAFGQGTKAYDILSIVPTDEPRSVLSLPRAG